MSSSCDTKYAPLCGAAVFRMGGYLVALYLVSKLFYIANVVSQLFVLNTVLGMTYSTFGIDMIKYATLRSVIVAGSSRPDLTRLYNFTAAFPLEYSALC